MDAIFVEEMPRSRVAVLLKHFSQLADGREPWRIVYRLAEVLLLLTCATIAECDDFDEIVAWGELHLDFLRGFSDAWRGRLRDCVGCSKRLRNLKQGVPLRGCHPKRGRVIIPGHAKVGPPGTIVDLIYGPLDEGWDLDACGATVKVRTERQSG